LRTVCLRGGESKPRRVCSDAKIIEESFDLSFTCIVAKWEFQTSRRSRFPPPHFHGLMYQESKDFGALNIWIFSVKLWCLK
jgi:hypothetical protein